MDLVHWSCKQMDCPDGHLPSRCPEFSEPVSNVKVPGEDTHQKKKLFNSREQQLTGLRNTKKVSLCLFKGPPFTHSSAHFLSPVTWGSVQTHLASKLSSSHPMSRLISNPRTQHDFHVTYAVSCLISGSLMQEENSWLRWTFGTEVVEHVAGPGSWTQRKASIYAESVGTEACQASMDHVRAHSSLPGRTGDFLKK